MSLSIGSCARCLPVPPSVGAAFPPCRRDALDTIPDVLLAAIRGHDEHHDDPEQDLERRRINVQAVEQQRELGEDQRSQDRSPVVPAPSLKGRSAQDDADCEFRRNPAGDSDLMSAAVPI